MYVCTGKECTGMYNQIVNKQRNILNQFLIHKTNYQVHAPTETEQSLTITVKLTKPRTSETLFYGMTFCEGKANKA